MNDRNIENNQRYPYLREVKPFLFALVFNIFARLPKKIRTFFSRILFGLSYNNRTDLSAIIDDKDYKRAFWAGWSITFFFGFVVLLAWTWKLGLLSGSDPNRVYFIYDYPNLINYIVICPSYIGLSCMLILIMLKGWRTLSSFPDTFNKRVSARLFLPASVMIGLPIVLAAFLIVRYASECVDPKVYSKLAWYITGIAQDGTRILTGLGFYYIILNYLLLLVGLLGFAAFLPLFAFGIEAGNSIRSLTPDENADIRLIKMKLDWFIKGYFVAKWLTAIYMANAFTWKWEKPQGSFNYFFMGAALSFFGVFFLSIPRYYIELEWLRFKIRKKLIVGDDLNLEDLRPHKTAVIVNFLDVIMIGGFIGAFWFG